MFNNHGVEGNTEVLITLLSHIIAVAVFVHASKENKKNRTKKTFNNSKTVNDRAIYVHIELYICTYRALYVLISTYRAIYVLIYTYRDIRTYMYFV